MIWRVLARGRETGGRVGFGRMLAQMGLNRQRAGRRAENASERRLTTVTASPGRRAAAVFTAQNRAGQAQAAEPAAPCDRSGARCGAQRFEARRSRRGRASCDITGRRRPRARDSAAEPAAAPRSPCHAFGLGSLQARSTPSPSTADEIDAPPRRALTDDAGRGTTARPPTAGMHARRSRPPDLAIALAGPDDSPVPTRQRHWDRSRPLSRDSRPAVPPHSPTPAPQSSHHTSLQP